ncbi:alcohol dehydrogenase catalytic domain-containing protein [Rhodospirillaceae bacterium KN72]|uniref:Alcohol dehydrogenase catalytic domain-containing protein n=1 Tax=Pacificispira spongiicola TaxID=2729598 RepID=A0A7Y0DWK2_9PROT|nr:alcohol dehydrogenase catalytic domain-containing protein [Pacificispira spongiicola]
MLPAVFGHEAAGVVEALGENVRGLTIGEPVVVVRWTGSTRRSMRSGPEPSCGMLSSSTKGLLFGVSVMGALVLVPFAAEGFFQGFIDFRSRRTRVELRDRGRTGRDVDIGRPVQRDRRGAAAHPIQREDDEDRAENDGMQEQSLRSQ